MNRKWSSIVDCWSAHEFVEPMLDAPDQVWAMLLVTPDQNQRGYLESIRFSSRPEVGSRIMTQIAMTADHYTT